MDPLSNKYWKSPLHRYYYLSRFYYNTLSMIFYVLWILWNFALNWPITNCKLGWTGPSPIAFLWLNALAYFPQIPSILSDFVRSAFSSCTNHLWNAKPKEMQSQTNSCKMRSFLSFFIKLALWLLTFLSAITCVLIIWMKCASPF